MLPPEIERFFAEERRKQQIHNTIAQTQRNLRDTALTMHQILEKTSQRGTTLEEREDQSEELLDSSDAFYTATMPGWKRYLHEWKAPWWWCFCKKRKKREYL